MSVAAPQDRAPLSDFQVAVPVDLRAERERHDEPAIDASHRHGRGVDAAGPSTAVFDDAERRVPALAGEGRPTEVVARTNRQRMPPDRGGDTVCRTTVVAMPVTCSLVCYISIQTLAD